MIRSLLYRFPRFRTEVPMDFILGDAVVLGVCVNISESGLRGTFSNFVPAGSKGIITLYHRDQSVQVHAQVESMQDDEARVSFSFDSDTERDQLSAFLKLLSPTAPWRRQAKP